MKKNKAITLIALIVTIIILLILAGVSIAMLSGDNGILNKAKTAKENSDSAGVEEQNKLGKTNESIDNYTTSRSLEISEIGNRTELWTGNVSTKNVIMTLSDSIENYKYLLIKDKWSSTPSTEVKWLETADIIKTGYFSSPSAENQSHMLISPYDNYYAYIAFTSNKTLVISNEDCTNIQIVGIYGVK